VNCTAGGKTEHRQSDSGSLTSSMIASLRDRPSSSAGNSALSSVLTEETNLSWSGAAPPIIDKVCRS